jgi:hypothetical protein
MYRFGHQIRHRYWPYLLAGILIVSGVAAGVVIARRTFQPQTSLTQAPMVVRHVSERETVTQHITKSVFTIDLPASWRSIPAPATTANGFSWQGTKGDEAALRLDVYIDRLPQSLAVNRLLPVQSAGSGLDITWDVSENCTNFTDKTPQSARTGTAPAKWHDVSFICDMGNYERAVAATGSAEGINTVSVTGPQTGSHRVMLVFTDNNISPDFSVFTQMVRSFRAR